MSVNVIDTIKPKNYGTFPVVEAPDVKVTNTKRLDTALNEKANQADLEALSSTVAEKASQSDLNALSAAVASKADKTALADTNAVVSTKASQASVEALSAAVDSKASAADLAATNVEVASKADSSDVATSVINLQAQIDNIVTPVTQDAEVENARVGTDGTSYDSLKQRLDTEISALDTDITQLGLVPIISNAYGFGGTPAKWVPSQGDTWGYYPIEPNATITLHKNASGRDLLYTFLKSKNTIVGEEVDFATGYTGSVTYQSNDFLTLTAPNDAHWLLCYQAYNDTDYSPNCILANGYNYLNSLEQNIKSLMQNNEKMLAGSRISQIYTDIDDLTENGMYLLQISASNPHPDNLPSDFLYDGSAWILICLKNVTIDGAGVNLNQMLYNVSAGKVMYHRSAFNGTWYSWTTLNNRVVTVGSGKQFTRLRDGIEYAIKSRGTTVYVENGYYDLVTEFADEIAANVANQQFGITLENDVHVIFSSGAFVAAEYEGSEANIVKCFNPFKCGQRYGFTLENLNIRAKNVRYCVHDDAGGTVFERNVYYKNCKMIMDNRTAAVDWFPQCIGGGFGIYDQITIDSCIFDSLTNNDPPLAVSYHNNGYVSTGEETRSTVTVKNCYFNHGTFRISHYGSATYISLANVNNCSLPLEPICTYEDQAHSPTVNTELLSYMNEIRS